LPSSLLTATVFLPSRYLLEKADVMCKQVMQGEESRSRWLLSLENLKSSFTWELRVLYLVPIALPFYMAGVTTVALIIGGVTGLGILTTDGIFSTMVTVIFLRLEGDWFRGGEGGGGFSWLSSFGWLKHERKP
jgi:hypothetical protein